MLNELEDWWNKLHHNWKKNILFNLDFPVQDLCQFKSLDSEVSIGAPYDVYFKRFKTGIRKRLDAFKATENELFDILNIDHFIVRHSYLKGLNPISILYNIRFLSLETGFTEDLDEIRSLKNLEYLNVSCWNLQELSSDLVFDKLKEIKFVYCYKLKNLKMLSNFSQLEIIDISWNAQIFDLSHLSNLEYLKKLIIKKNQIVHSGNADVLLNENERNHYIDSDVLDTNVDIKQLNYLSFFRKSRKFILIKTEFNVWTIERRN